jgi:HAD superfamily hydrolase (TIGR01509 family)
VTELVIFDCDGVLVDSEPISNRVLAELLTEIGMPSTVEGCMRDYMGRSWADCVALIEARLGRPAPPDFGETWRARRNAALEAEVVAVAGVEAALDAIDAEICVASSGSPEKIRLTLGKTGLLDRFDGRVFSATQVEGGKPAPDLFLYAAMAMGTAPGDCVVVEDAAIGIAAARAAGMRALGFAARTDAEALAGDGAETFDSMEALPTLLGSRGA